MDYAQSEIVASAVQGILRLNSPNLIVDGRMGKFTRDAFDRAPADIKAAARRAAQALGVDYDKLVDYQRGVENKASSLGKYISRIEVDALIRRAATLLKETALTEKLLGFVDLEANKKVVDGVPYYNLESRSPNGKYWGLFQMGQAAWSDASDELARFGYRLPSFVAGRTEAEPSVFAGVAYSVINARGLRKRNLPVTAQTLYAAHNQGLGGYASYVKTGEVMFPKQSRDALAVLAQAYQQGKTA